jgi:hypothetical protein
LILQRITDSPHQESRDVVIYIGVLPAKGSNGHGYGRLHGAQAIRHLPKTRGDTLDLHGRTSGHGRRSL